MKKFFGIVSVMFLIGCSETPNPISSPSAETSYSLYQVACEGAITSNYVIHNREVDLQIDSTVAPGIQELYLQAFEFWGVKINSVELSNPSDTFNPNKMILVDCQGKDSREVMAWENGGAILNHPELFPAISEEQQKLILAHEIGHVIGLDDSSEWSIMNGGAVYQGCSTLTASEKQLSETLLFRQ